MPQRIPAFRAGLLLSFLLAVSAIAHLSLAASPPVLTGWSAEGDVGAGVEAVAGEVEAEVPRPSSAGREEAQPTPVPRRDWSSVPLSSEELIYDGRGAWLTDRSRGPVARIDRGPTPRQTVLLPILMYHHVQPVNLKTSGAFVASLTLPPEEFELQLRHLKETGFQSATMRDLERYLQGRADLPDLSVILSFDDGYRDNYSYAFPLLVRYGFKGTFFIITGLVGQSDYMTWPQLREMLAAGMEIGSHTVNHVDLAKVLPAVRDRELVESKRTLENALGVSVRALSYPSGAYSQEAMAAAGRAGYATAVTTNYGATDERTKLLELPRVRIQGTDTLPVFRWRLDQYFPTSGPAAS